MSKSASAGKQGGPRPRGDVARDLGEAAWAEADRALALAWRDVSKLEAEIARAARASRRASEETESRLSARIEAAAADALLARQRLARAAQLRGLRAFGETDETERFNRVRHEFDGPEPKAPDWVRIVRPGIMRDGAAGAEVLAPAVVRLAKAPAVKTRASGTRK